VTGVVKVDSHLADHNATSLFRPSAVIPSAAIIGNSDLIVWNLEASSRYIIVLNATQPDGLPVTQFSVQYWTLSEPSVRRLNPLDVLRITSTTIVLSTINTNELRRRRTSDDSHLASDYYVIVEQTNNQHHSIFEDLVHSGAANVYDRKTFPRQEPILRFYDEVPSRPYYVEFHLNDWPPEDHLVIGQYRALQPNTFYMIWFANGLTVDEATHLEWSRLSQVVKTDSANHTFGAIIAIFFGVLFIVAIVIFILYFYCYPIYRKSTKQSPSASTNNLVSRFQEYLYLMKIKSRKCVVEGPSASRCLDVKDVYSDDQPKKCIHDTFDQSFYVVKSSNPIPLSQLRRNYEKRLLPNAYYAMQAEFQRVPRCSTDATHVADHPHHANLNCCRASLPYDKNRVILSREQLRRRVYINASVIRTLSYHPTVIVTQRPTEQTVGLFWRTVWQKNIGSIVMLVAYDDVLSATYSGYKYWPDSQSQSAVYGNLVVDMLGEQKYSYIEIRWLRINGLVDDTIETRIVLHWQYIKWRPTGSLPYHPLQFIDFIKQVQRRHEATKGLLVHCECGTGASGVFLALDALAVEARKTGLVDVENCVTLLCLERMNLVHTFLQYRFIHQCTLEMFLVNHNTSMPMSYFKDTYASLSQCSAQTVHALVQYEYCKLVLPCYAFSKSLDLIDSLHANTCNSNSTPDYISMDGYLAKNLFTLPSPKLCSSIEQIWKLVYNLKARAVVVLCRLGNPDWLPPAGHSRCVGKYLISCENVRTNPTKCFYVIDLTIVQQCSDNSVILAVRLYESTVWTSISELPPHSLALDLLSNLADWSRQDTARRPVVFYCEPNADRGWYSQVALVVTIWSILDRIQTDQMVDVFLAARYSWTIIPEAFTTYVSSCDSKISANGNTCVSVIGVLCRYNLCIWATRYQCLKLTCCYSPTACLALFSVCISAKIGLYKIISMNE